MKEQRENSDRLAYRPVTQSFKQAFPAFNDLIGLYTNKKDKKIADPVNDNIGDQIAKKLKKKYEEK